MMSTTSLNNRVGYFIILLFQLTVNSFIYSEETIKFQNIYDLDGDGIKESLLLNSSSPKDLANWVFPTPV